MNVADLINQARRKPQIIELAPDAVRGAEAYFQSYEYIVHGGQARTKRGQRRLAMSYLTITATPPLTDTQMNAARLASTVLKRLS